MISTGLKKIDDFLSGGIPNGVIVDIFGGNGTGKTQLLLQLSINSIKNGGKVLFLDTTGGFRPERILEIQKKSNSNLNLLNNIIVSRITNTSEQINSIKNFKENGITVHEKVLTFDDFNSADEVFMSGNMKKVTPITAFDEVSYQTGPLTKMAREMYWDWALSEKI